MRLGSKKKSNDGAGVTIKSKWFKTFSNFLFGKKGQDACSAQMAIAIRDVLLTRLFGRNDWSTLDDKHVDGKPSRFAEWPDIFEKEEVKKASGSDSSESKPRKRNAKADKKVKKAKVAPTTSSESSNPDSAITEQVSVETSPK